MKLTDTQIRDIREAILRYGDDTDVVVAYGGGVDSTAMQIMLHQCGITPSLTLFANTGAEKPETYDYVEYFKSWQRQSGFPLTVGVAKKTLPSTPYSDLTGECMANGTLPSLALGMKSCSIKWKHGPQDQYLKGVTKGPNKRDPHPVFARAKAAGRKVVKLIGYDAGPADIRRSGKPGKADPDFINVYPLQIAGWTRAECIAAIVQQDLRVPMKSACWFCPASKPWELFWLAGHHPQLFMQALALEHNFMTGPHSRLDEAHYDDAWQADVKNAPSLPTTKVCVGLGRSFAWNSFAREHGIVDREGNWIGDAEWCKAMAEDLTRTDNALDARSC